MKSIQKQIGVLWAQRTRPQPQRREHCDDANQEKTNTNSHRRTTTTTTTTTKGMQLQRQYTITERGIIFNKMKKKKKSF